MLSFAGVALMASLIPGPDAAVVLKNAMSRGLWAAMRTAAGCSAGQLAWGLASVAGIATVLATSVIAFTVVKFVGAAYLLFLGVRSFVQARKAGSAVQTARLVTASEYRRSGSVFGEGLLTNALNPKTALFMSALLPQFLPVSGPSWLALVFVAITAVISFAWMSAYAVIFSRFGNIMQKPAVRRTVDRVMGTVLVGLGVRLAAERA
ncbi:LysE family translocator [Streptomyces sp. NPDC088762]|uniref:LysE family translocator n=1 Tax=Streptomyces sp. NPDC088762 TaxID=3365891 RepID=UPI0038305A1C